MKINRGVIVGMSLMAGALVNATPALALNYYELETYPYRTAAKGELEIENSTGYTARGTNDAPAPDNNDGLWRNSVEMTYGVSNHLELTAYGDLQRARGESWSFGGQRYHARMSFFEKGELPVDLGAYVELEMPKHDVDTHEVEMRGIVEKDLGKWTLDFNPVVEKVLRGQSVAEGWALKYAAAVVYRYSECVQPRLDLFGDVGPVRNFSPQEEQQHLLMPGVTVKLEHNWFVSAGAGIGLTDSTEQRVLRVRVEKEFY
jgi:hypothetical protein